MTLRHCCTNVCERMIAMPSKEYLEAKKEFKNCLVMSVFGCGVPIIIAFKEWWPIMKAEKAKEKAQA